MNRLVTGFAYNFFVMLESLIVCLVKLSCFAQDVGNKNVPTCLMKTHSFYS